LEGLYLIAIDGVIVFLEDYILYNTSFHLLLAVCLYHFVLLLSLFQINGFQNLEKSKKRPDDKKGATIMSLRRSFRDASIRAKYYGLFGD